MITRNQWIISYVWQSYQTSVETKNENHHSANKSSSLFLIRWKEKKKKISSYKMKKKKQKNTTMEVWYLQRSSWSFWRLNRKIGQNSRKSKTKKSESRLFGSMRWPSSRRQLVHNVRVNESIIRATKARKPKTTIRTLKLGIFLLFLFSRSVLSYSLWTHGYILHVIKYGVTQDGCWQILGVI